MSYQNIQSVLYSPQDKCRCFWQKWIPETPIQRTIVFQHGIGEHSNRYANLIQHFAGSGTAFYAMDTRGHGQSEGKKGQVSSLMDCVHDLHALVRLSIEEQGGRLPFLIGHSMGGAIAALYALTYQQHLHALVLSSPAIQPYKNFFMRMASFAARALVPILPTLTLSSNINQKYLSHDQQTITDYNADPLVHEFASVRLGYDMFQVHHTLYEKAPELHIPLYIMHGTGDRITDPDASQKFYELAGSQDKTIKLYDGLYHEMMNETAQERKIVLNDLKAWIEAH